MTLHFDLATPREVPKARKAASLSAEHRWGSGGYALSTGPKVESFTG